MKLWQRLFLEERPSIGLAFFRIAAAVAAGLHACPSFFHLKEFYLSGAFKTYNGNFFTVESLQLVARSPDWLVVVAACVLWVSWFCFLVGFFTQASGSVMLAGLIYFYALNDFYIGSSLAWDLLLVTIFLLCLTPYPGDYFSVDALRRADADAWRTRRPFFIQRLLQIQIATTFFFTAFYKIYPNGNWLTGNPLYYLMLYPHEGTTKYFLLREFLAAHPALCYKLGIFIMSMEFLLPFLLFWPPTRISAIILGSFFHVCLLLTLDVPAIFFFLYPPQLLLFIHPDKIVRYIERKRELNAAGKRSVILYDGKCQFCRASVRQLAVMDLFGTLRMLDLHSGEDLAALHPGLTKERAVSQLHLLEPYGELYGGFFVFRRLVWKLPMLFPWVALFYFPGSAIVGPWAYRWVAKNRYLFHSNRVCRDNACYIKK